MTRDRREANRQRPEMPDRADEESIYFPYYEPGTIGYLANFGVSMTATRTTRGPRDPEANIHSPRVEPVDVGDVEAIPEAPLLTPPNGHGLPSLDQAGQVIVNHSLQSLEHGARCIRVDHAGATDLTAREAVRLGTELIEAGEDVARKRQLRGFDE